MSASFTINQIQGKFGFFTAILLVIMFSSCVSKSPFLTSTVLPAARGYVLVKKDKNMNYNIELNLEHLAEASRLNPPKSTYVIWMESDGKTTKNIGQINTASKSSKLKASFDSASSSKPNLIYITAEDDGATSYPSELVVLTTRRLKEIE